MRKLFLASTKFKVGDNEFEQHNLVVVETASDRRSIEFDSAEAVQIAKQCFIQDSEGTDREWLGTTVTQTYTKGMVKEEEKYHIRPTFYQAFGPNDYPTIDNDADNADQLSVHVLIDINGRKEYFDTGWYNFDEKEWVNCNKDFTTEISKGNFRWMYIN